MEFLKVVLQTLGDMAVMLGVIGAIGLVYVVAYAALHRGYGEDEDLHLTDAEWHEATAMIEARRRYPELLTLDGAVGTKKEDK